MSLINLILNPGAAKTDLEMQEKILIMRTAQDNERKS